ncbi:DegV family protein [Chloroflexota bacterium]
MTIKIVTDSTADLPLEVTEEMNINVIPAYIHVGNDSYRDRVNISDEEFYGRLLDGPEHPKTEPALPEDFAAIYRELGDKAEGIISIHISSKISATCNAASRGLKLSGTECPVEVIDSGSVSMALGLLTIAAAEMVRSGKGYQEIISETNRMTSNIHILGLFDSLKYLARGGRINRAVNIFGTMLNIKPMLTTRDGEVEPAGHVQRRAAGINNLYRFVKETNDIVDAAVVYSTTPDEAADLANKIAPLTPQVRLAKLGPVMGVHGGPGALFVALRTSS